MTVTCIRRADTPTTSWLHSYTMQLCEMLRCYLYLRRLKKMEKRKEAKAEKAANIESSIEVQLMERLKSGTYGDIYNFPLAQYHKALDSSNAEPDQQAIETEDAVETMGEESEEESEDEVCSAHGLSNSTSHLYLPPSLTLQHAYEGANTSKKYRFET